MENRAELESRIRELTGWPSVGRMQLLGDTSDPMAIQRGDLLDLAGHRYVIQGHRYETRFGISDQPKYWVLGAIDVANGERKILKTVFAEKFNVHIGVFKIHCFRSPDKESRVLEMVRGDLRFMQGYTAYDSQNSNVRVLDFIRGDSLFRTIYQINKPHEEFFHEDLGGYLRNLRGCFEAIHHLHEMGTCHGDIRNDHILIESETGRYRWIDFDLNQHVSDFDTWSMGNIINYVVGMGITPFRHVLKGDTFSDEIKNSLHASDASAFYEYRIMNLGKLYPYLPKRLVNILLHFTTQPQAYYESSAQLLEEYNEMLDNDFPA